MVGPSGTDKVVANLPDSTLATVSTLDLEPADSNFDVYVVNTSGPVFTITHQSW